MTTNHVPMLLAIATIPNSELKADEMDKMWADFGRTVHHNLMHEDLVKVLNRACLTSATHKELTAAVRAFILTRVKP